jgi:hypothetical protein
VRVITAHGTISSPFSFNSAPTDFSKSFVARSDVLSGLSRTPVRAKVRYFLGTANFRSSRCARGSVCYKTYFSTTKFSRTSISISLFENVLNAFAGVFTMGSPFRLKEVFSSAGTPVAWANLSIN